MATMEEETTNQSLPTDIIIQVLTFLSAKPLTRFKLVSKSFLSLINDPDFIFSHIQRSISTHSNLSLAAISHDFPTETLHVLHLPTPDNSTSPTITKLPLPFTPNSSVSDLIGSCNGILCVAAFPGFVGLVNSTCMTFENIPLGEVEPDDEYGSRHWVDFGFGFDGVGKDYKVVRVDQVHSEKEGVGCREVRVFSLKKKLWKKVDDFPYYLSHPMSHGKFLCNSLHWIASTTDPVVFCMTGMLWRGRLDDYMYDYLIVAFDVNLEKFRVLPLPDCYDVGEGGGKLVLPRLCVGVLGEWLFVQVEHGPKFGRCVDVWVMKEYGVKESWVRLLSFSYMEVRNELLPVKTLALSKGGKEVLMQIGKDCFWYELGSGVIRDVMIDGGLPYLFELISGHRCFFGAEVYVESLVCLSDQVGRLGVEPVGNAGGEDGELDVNEVKKKIKEPNERCGLLSSRFKLK